MFKHHMVSTLMKDNCVTKVALSKEIDMSISGLNKILTGESKPGVDKLEKIADFFSVSIDSFFERDIEIEDKKSSIHIGHKVGGTSNVVGDITMSECKKEIDHLHTLIKEKEVQLELLRNQILDKDKIIELLMANR